MTVTAAALMLAVGCIRSARIEDFTRNQSSVCEVHEQPMKQKRVPMTFGMRRSPWIMDLREARSKLFPHADEVYDTYYCMPAYEKYARIYVCSRCTTARTDWFHSRPPPRQIW